MKIEFILLSIIHIIFCTISITVIIQDAKKNGLRSLTLGSAFFLIISTFGLSFSHFVNYGEALPFSDDTGMIVYKNDAILYINQLIAHWIYIFGTTLAIILTGKHKILFNINLPVLQNKFRWRFILILGVVYSYVNYFLIGPGLDTFLSTNIVYITADDAVAARSLTKENFYGKGAYMASVSANILLPVIYGSVAAECSIKSHLHNRKTKYYFYLIICFTLSLIYSFQTRQKAPLIQTIIVYTLINITSNKDNLNNHQTKSKYNIFFYGLGFFVLSVLSYVIIFNMNVGDSIISALTRIFLVPSATELNYFYTFPDFFSYRGILNSFVIRLFNAPGISDITVHDVAYAATGNVFSANASFLAVGWSGYGYIGVLLVVSIYIISLIFVDALTMTRDKVIRQISMILMIVPFMTINSASFLDFIGVGGVVAPILFLLSTKNRSRNLNLKKSITVL